MWKTVKLEDICQIGDGNHSSNYPKSSEMVEQGVPFLRAGNIQSGTVSDKDLKFITPIKHLILKKGHLKKGDVLITNRGEIGKTAIVPKIFDGANLNSQVAWLRPDERLLSAFLYYVLNTPSARASFKSRQTGTALQQLTIRQIKQLEIPLPPLAEQERIVAKLDAAFAEIDEAINAAIAKETEVQKLKASLLSSSLSGDAVMWEYIPFENCLEKTKIKFKLPKKDYRESGKYPIISQEDSLISGYHDDISNIFKVAKPIVVFGDHTLALKYIDFDFIVGADGVKILQPIEEINTKYFYYALKALIPKTTGYARHYKLLKKLDIPVPPLAEQQLISARLDAAYSEFKNTNELIAKSKVNLLALKSAILKQELQSSEAA